MMRKLKGAVKENARQKRERKQEFAKSRQQIHTIVLPTFAVIFLFICLYVYMKTRPSSMQYATRRYWVRTSPGTRPRLAARPWARAVQSASTSRR
ncbi:Uncharacterized protein OBRU01_20634, partial [Operophtera brumata]